MLLTLTFILSGAMSASGPICELQQCKSDLAACQTALANVKCSATPNPKPKSLPRPKKPVVASGVKECCKDKDTGPAPSINTVNVTNNVSTDNRVTVNININVAVNQGGIALIVPEESSFKIGVGLRGSIGMWSCNPHVFALVGVRVRAPTIHLGAEVNTQFDWGHSFQVMVYPVQGPVSWHIDAGALWIPKYGFSVQDVSRKWDVLLGTGLEFVLIPHLSFIADLRFTTVNPFDMARLEKNSSLNVGNVIGNSFARTQLMFGLLLHTW
jgi:hypothetical protein